MAKEETTPMMKQFWEMKDKHPGAIMLFRVGDFYETYGEDAITATEILGITLTHRSNAGGKPLEMAGFPHHALDTYLPRLVRAGKRVAICDQLEDPKLTKKLVKRGITELVTPGVSINDNILNFKENNFLAAVHTNKKAGMAGVAFLDISTGEFLTAEGTYEYVDKLLNNMNPKEVVYEKGKKNEFEEHFGNKYFTFEQDDWIFTIESANDRLLKHFQTTNLKGFGIDHLQLAVVASGAILYYLDTTQHTQIGHITHISRIEEEKYVWLDRFTIRNLELFGSIFDGGSSLAATIDHTSSPMGARLLKRWISFPLKDVKPIQNRLDVVDAFFREPELAETIGNSLGAIGDLERIISKVAVGRVNPREVVQLKVALKALEPLKRACELSECEHLRKIGEQINPCQSISEKIERTVLNDPPILLSRGNVIASGVDSELDDLRNLAHNSKQYLADIQEREARETGISSLKVAYNNVFGYYIEVRNTYKEQLQQLIDEGKVTGWVRKQTLAGAERYITQELKEYEEKILTAEDRILSIEGRLFAELVQELADFIPAIQLDANLVARIDCLLSFARVAKENHYVRPVVNDGDTIAITQGRHPVIEKQLPLGQTYIANDLLLSSSDQQIMMITGPNMAGKSALLRQTALITLMAQIGCFVPADSATIGVVDKIFTRVGASDNISMGESTFMVEMNEAASIINNLSERSLVLFDELGRGTSTYDGISIAWAIVEYIHENPNAHAKTLFATHYHELNEMEKTFKRIKNYNVQVKEIDGKVIFLRKLVRGGSEHSFGIHVAKIAGLPKNVVDRANEVLHQLETAAGGSTAMADKPKTEAIGTAATPGMQLSFFQLDDPVLSQVRDEIIGLDINNLTPMEALNRLFDIKRIVTGKQDWVKK
ncbi:MAG: DNA mismatch repair protein MutS [Paludibacteraceae bacterium]|nr:DNA mismatch repair protein MutS [Paludibacteraceae bacterium]